MTPPPAPYLSSYLLIYLLRRVCTVCVMSPSSPPPSPSPLSLFFLLPQLALSKMKWDAGGKWSVPFKPFFFLNYLPCSELLLASVWNPWLVRLCFGSAFLLISSVLFVFFSSSSRLHLLYEMVGSDVFEAASL